MRENNNNINNKYNGNLGEENGGRTTPGRRGAGSSTPSILNRGRRCVFPPSLLLLTRPYRPLAGLRIPPRPRPSGGATGVFSKPQRTPGPPAGETARPPVPSPLLQVTLELKLHHYVLHIALYTPCCETSPGMEEVSKRHNRSRWRGAERSGREVV